MNYVTGAARSHFEEEPINMSQNRIRYFTWQRLKEANDRARELGFKRQLSDHRIDHLKRKKIYPIASTIAHDTFVSCEVSLDGTGRRAWLDVEPSVYHSLDIFEVARETPLTKVA
jgi:hypothetical protein